MRYSIYDEPIRRGGPAFSGVAASLGGNEDVSNAIANGMSFSCKGRITNSLSSSTAAIWGYYLSTRNLRFREAAKKVRGRGVEIS